MVLRDILVVLEDSAPCLARLEAAVQLAGRHGAHLTGLYFAASGEEGRGRIERAFRQQSAEAGVPSEWIREEPQAAARGPAQSVSDHARFTDLVVVGQPSGEHSSALPADLGERVLLDAGRPVLWIPFAGHHASLGRRVVVAWKPGRAAGRAARDALPLLAQARDVRVLTVSPDGGDEAAAARLCGYLAKHDIAARPEQLRGSVDTGDLLLNRACEDGCDLMVAGAYAGSHFGPVARHLLKFMTVPVFMSH